MQSHRITLSFHREMTDSSRELVGPDSSAAAIFESYPRFIKRGFENCEGLGIKRSTADSKHVPSPRSRLLGNNVFELPPRNSRIFGITGKFARVAVAACNKITPPSNSERPPSDAVPPPAGRYRHKVHPRGP